jgi:hypothetical protein
VQFSKDKIKFGLGAALVVVNLLLRRVLLLLPMFNFLIDRVFRVWWYILLLASDSKGV